MASNEWLVRKLHEQDKKIEALSRGGTGVGHTSIAPGENLTVISDNGEVVLGAGGVEHVDGPTPATPSAPTLKLGFGTIETTWDGSFAEGEDEDGVPLTAPVDFDVVEVHCSTDPEEEEWGDDTRRGQIKTREGGTITVGGFDVDDEVFVCLIALAKTGKRSAPSATASLVIEGLDFSALFNELDAANATIKNAGEVLVTEQGTLDEKLTEVDGTLNDLGQDLQAVEDAQEQLNTDLTDVMTSVDGKNTITWNPSAPSKVANPGKASGDMWYRTSGNNIIGFWKWDGTDWVTQLLDKTTIPLIDIGAGTFGSLDGARLKVGSIYADSIVSGLSQNMVPDPGFASAAINNYRVSSANTYGAVISIADGVLKIDCTPGITAASNVSLAATSDLYAWPVYPAMKVRASVSARGVGSFRLNIRYRKRDGSTVYTTMTPTFYTPLTSTFTEYAYQSDMPQDATGFSIVIQVHSSSTGLCEFRSPFAASAVGATVIENGAISTEKLTADVLEVKNLKATSGQLDEAVINKLFSDVVVAKTAVAEQFIGENAILTGAVTAPKITASEELWAKIAQFVEIRAEHIKSDAIDSMVVTGGTYRTSGGNGSWSDAGLFISQPDGTSMVRFPTDGSPLSLTASDTQIERASVGELDVSNGAIHSGGQFTLASGVTAPASPPELTTGWQFEAQLPRPAEPSMDWAGLAYWNGLYVRGVNVLTSAGDPYDRIELYNPDGSLNRSINIDLNPRAGVAVIGDIVYTIGPDHVASNAGKQWCHGFNLNTGARVSRWEYVHFYAANQKKIAIGVDGSNLLVAGVAPNAVLSVFKYTPSTGAQVGSQMSTNFDVGYAADIHGVAAAGGKIYVSPRGQVREYTVSGSTLTKTAGFAWDNPNWNSGGFTFVGGVPYVVDSGVVYQGSTATAGAVSEVCYTWWDGTHESTPSPVATVESKPRETVTVSLPIRTGLQKRLYSRPVGGGNWARAVIPENVSVFPRPTGFANYSPPATNTFPNADPATLKSTNDKFEVKGDGSGRWGPLTFNTDGSMSGMRRTAAGRIPITVTDSTAGFQTETVQFPIGRFTDPPVVTVSPDTTSSALVNVGVLSVTAEQATISVRRTNSTTTVVNWIATEVD